MTRLAALTLSAFLLGCTSFKPALPNYSVEKAWRPNGTAENPVMLRTERKGVLELGKLCYSDSKEHLYAYQDGAWYGVGEVQAKDTDTNTVAMTIETRDLIIDKMNEPTIYHTHPVFGNVQERITLAESHGLEYSVRDAVLVDRFNSSVPSSIDLYVAILNHIESTTRGSRITSRLVYLENIEDLDGIKLPLRNTLIRVLEYGARQGYDFGLNAEPAAKDLEDLKINAFMWSNTYGSMQDSYIRYFLKTGKEPDTSEFFSEVEKVLPMFYFKRVSMFEDDKPQEIYVKPVGALE